MLYYVKTGDIDTSLHATSHAEAARISLENSSDEPGFCVVVSKKVIEEQNASHEVYFLTENFSRPRFRIVG